MQIRKYRGASKDGIAVKSKISLHNKRWHRGAIINVVAQQKIASRWIQKYREVTKDGIAVKSKILWRNKRWHRGGFINIVKQQKDSIRCKHKYRESNKRRDRGEHENIMIVRTFFTPILKAIENKVS